MGEVSRSIPAGFLCPSVRMSCVFSSEVLPSSSGGQPRAAETPCIVSNAPGSSLPKNSYRVHPWHWDLLLITHVFWGHLIFGDCICNWPWSSHFHAGQLASPSNLSLSALPGLGLQVCASMPGFSPGSRGLNSVLHAGAQPFTNRAISRPLFLFPNQATLHYCGCDQRACQPYWVTPYVTDRMTWKTGVQPQLLCFQLTDPVSHWLLRLRRVFFRLTGFPI